MSVALTIRQLRKSQGLTQKELARLVECAPTTVSAWERGAAFPLLEKARKLAEIFNVPVSRFSDQTKAELQRPKDTVLLIGDLRDNNPIFPFEPKPVEIPKALKKLHPNAFMLRTDTDNANKILVENSLVLIDPDMKCKYGDLVLAEAKGSAIIARYFPAGNNIVFEYESLQKLDPIFIRSDIIKRKNLKIVGRVIWFMSDPDRIL